MLLFRLWRCMVPPVFLFFGKWRWLGVGCVQLHTRLVGPDYQLYACRSLYMGDRLGRVMLTPNVKVVIVIVMRLYWPHRSPVMHAFARIHLARRNASLIER